MSVTRTGGFTIGFRRMGSAWQKDLSALCQWAKANEFGAIDLGRDGDAAAKAAVAAGITSVEEILRVVPPETGR